MQADTHTFRMSAGKRLEAKPLKEFAARGWCSPVVAEQLY